MKKIFIFILVLPFLSFAQYEQQIDSLKKVISSKIPNNDKAEAYHTIVETYLYSDTKIALKYMNTLYDLNKDGSCSKCEDFANLEKGDYYNLLMDYKKSIYYYDLCAKKSLERKDYEVYEVAKMQKIQTILNFDKKYNIENDVAELLAIKKKYNLNENYEYVYFLTAEFNTTRQFNQTALKYYLMCDEIMTKNKSADIPFKINVNNMIATVYSNLKNHEKARQYNNISINLAKKTNDIQYEMLSYQQKGFTESVAHNFKEAIPYLKKAYDYFAKNNAVIYTEQLANSLGESYLETKDYEKSLYYSNIVIDIYKSKKIGENYGRALKTRALVRLHFNEFDKAKEDIYLAKSLIKNNKLPGYFNEIIEAEIEYLYKTKQFEKAIKAIKTKDSLGLIIKDRTDLINLNELEAKYQNEKKETQIKLLSTQNELSKKQKYIYIGLLGLLALIGGLLFYGYRNKIKTAQKLNELNELKSRFFANISHEFRTPLTLIKSPVQSLQSEIKDENQIKKLNLIDTNSTRMLELVDQLLELSKIDSGNLKLILKEGNISNFLFSIIEPFQFQAVENNLTLISNIEKQNQNDYFDKDVIQKIVSNLISNALKYAKPKTEIHFDSIMEYSNLILTFSNETSELKSEDIPKLFERFYQKNEYQNGFGIGLALVKELVDLYRGTLTTDFVDNKLTIHIDLPLEKSNTNAVIITTENQQITTENSISSTNELPVLLLVDDNSEIRTVLKDIFKENYQILEAQDGEEALKIAQKEIPDCIISDVMMPKMDGFEFTKQIKNNELTSFIPVILLTAKTSDEAHLEGLKSTADAYLTKPFNNEIVKETVKQLIAERKKLQIRYSQELILRPTDIVINSVDEKFVERLQKVLDENMSNSEYSADDFSKDTGMSRMQLHRKLKTLFGVSTSEFLRNERLKISAELLKKGNGNISEIAYSVGFSDVSYFSKCFKEMYHCTPTEYINKN
ncbi:response regulator [Flavobacterium sp. SUN052]|uniref:response regulator n=1 Tax=Flavobacterium sp. SUN052 TaxID=3002441 RepID=UPI00237DFC32|nr:response regulator [Flavobacterium sp. SUN052]MEC4005758.1 response regulator [Flavobacterium sp. SUN052]